jgi:hypothetical protein
LPLRLLILAAGLRKIVAEFGPTWIVVEKPPVGFTYARHRAKQVTDQGFIGDTMAGCHQAAGALKVVAAELLGPGCVFEQGAGKVPKSERWAVLYALWPHMRNRGSNADSRDAAWIGMQALMDARRVWYQRVSA